MRPTEMTPQHTRLRIPKRYGPILFALIMSVTLSGALSFIITAINTGFDADFLSRWVRSYALAWALAFPAVTFLAPLVRNLVERVTEEH